MYIMLFLIIGSLLLGFTGRLPEKVQTRVIIVAAICATTLYYLSKRAM